MYRCTSNIYQLILTGNTVPSLKDLYLHITPQYAADWKVIGTLLGLPSGELKAIEAGYPTNVKWCCNQMLEKRLEMDPTASWGKLFTVIESPAVSSDQAVDKGDCYSCMYKARQNWFSSIQTPALLCYII